MLDKDQETEEMPAAPAAPAPRRGPGHRGADMRDTVAEMAERAQLISQEAGSKVSSAMKDVISAAAGPDGLDVRAREVGDRQGGSRCGGSGGGGDRTSAASGCVLASDWWSASSREA